MVGSHSEMPESSAARPIVGRSRNPKQKAKVKDQVASSVFQQLSQTHDVTGKQDLLASLKRHFERLPTRYALEIYDSDPFNVLMHKDLLDAAETTDDNSPLIHVRTVEQVVAEEAAEDPSSPHRSLTRRHNRMHPPPAFGSSPNLMLLDKNGGSVPKSTSWDRISRSYGDESMDGSLNWDDRGEESLQVLHEITIAGRDLPHRLTTLSAAVCDIGLNVREAHVFTTSDKLLLDIFVTDQMPGVAHEIMQEMLRDAVEAQISLEAERRPAGGRAASLGAGDGAGAADRCGSGGGPSKAHFDDWDLDASKLELGPKISGGAFGDVHRGHYCGQVVAVKVLRMDDVQGNLQDEFRQEVSILRKVRHKNVVQFLGVCTIASTSQMCIVTEFMEKGSLYEDLKKNAQRLGGKGLSPGMVIKVGLDVARGMDYLHKMGIVHRDLKASNLLLDEHNVVKVADFGVSRMIDHEGNMTAETGSYRWMAPEVIEHLEYDSSVDVFGFGITLWELLNNRVPYSHLTPLQAAIGVLQRRMRPEIPESCPADLAQLMTQCWDHDRARRPDFGTIIQAMTEMQKRYPVTSPEAHPPSLSSACARSPKPDLEKKKSFFSQFRKLSIAKQ